MKAADKAKAVKGMMPNWQRKPIAMPQGLFRCPQSFWTSTAHPMVNIIKASMKVSTMLNARLSFALKSLGTRQLAPEQIVA